MIRGTYVICNSAVLYLVMAVIAKTSRNWATMEKMTTAGDATDSE